MKKLLIILLIVQAISSAISFFALLSSSIILAIIQLFIGILVVTLTLAVIINTDDIENLKYELTRLREDFRKQDQSYEFKENAPPTTHYNDTAKGTWECIKCGTVNKAGTTHCTNCAAEYSSYINPTSNPFVKKKISRWVKK